MEVDKLRDFVLAQVVASCVGQEVDGLSCLPHLENEGGKSVKRRRVGGRVRHACVFWGSSQHPPCWRGCPDHLPAPWNAAAAPGFC